MGTCAVSCYKLSRSQKLVTVLNLTYVQMRESGYINHCVTVMLADAKAKTVTSLLTQLTVLAVGIYYSGIVTCHAVLKSSFISSAQDFEMSFLSISFMESWFFLDNTSICTSF